MSGMKRGISEVLTRTLWWLLGLIVLVFAPVAIGFGFNRGLEALVICLLLMLGWHLAFLAQLLGWLEEALDRPLPRGRGLWEIVFSGLHRRIRIRQGQQKALSETLERFIRAFQALPDGVIAFDKNRHIDWINERAEAHFAISAEADRGQALTNLIRHPDFVAYLDRGQYTEPLIYRDGRVEGLSLLLQIIPYGNEQNLLVSRDISQLERIETMRRDFIANVSHELKTPLTVVAGFSEMLSENREINDNAEIKHYLSLICEQTVRMQRLIEDLLTLSALEAEAFAPNDGRVEIEPMLNSILTEARSLSNGQHQITLSIGTPSILAGSANELRSAFGNLAGNAVRYTPTGGKIDLLWRVH